VISISVMRDKQLGDFRDANNRVIRQAKVMKQSEGEAGTTWKFVLPAIEIDRNEYGEPVTSCVVTPPAKEEGEVVDKGFKASANDSMFLKALLSALADKGQTPSPLMALPHSIAKVVDYEHVKEAFKNLNPDDGDDAARWRERLKQALRRARERLLDHRIIGVNSPYIWITGKPVRGIIRPRGDAPVERETSAGMEEVLASDGDIQL